MNKKQKIIALLLIIIFGCMLYANSLIKENRQLERTIPNKIEIKQEMEAISSNIDKFNKYCDMLQQNYKKNPVNEALIIEKLKISKIYSQDKFSIKSSVPEQIGPFNLITYHIDGRNLETQQIAPLIKTSEELSLGNPTIEIAQNDAISVKINIYSLIPLDKE